MNELFEHIGKRMPYHESEGYVEGLIERATDAAVASRPQSHRKRNRAMVWASAAAVGLLLMGIGFTLTDDSGKAPVAAQQQSPIDEFLNTLSDEEAAQLQYYEVEEIPEY